MNSGSGKRKSVNKLGRAVLINCILFALLISISAGALGFVIYYQGGIKNDQSYLSMLLDLSEEEIDGDDLKNCIETGETSELFDEMQLFLNDIKNNSEIQYIYAVLPLNTEETDNMMYVVTGVSDEERELYSDVISLGDLSGSENSPEVAQYFLDQMKRTDGSISYYRNRSEFGYMYTGMKTITDSKGEAVCVLAVDISMDDIFEFLNRYLIFMGLGCLLLTILFLIGQICWMRTRITGPLNNLEDAANALKNAAEDASSPEELVFDKPETPKDDEIRSLADALEEMALDMQNYMSRLQTETKEKERIASELGLAREIQESALPSVFPPFPEREEIELYATMDPAKEVGGDFYDYFFVDPDHMAIVMADVSGKGVPAALFMMISKALLKNRTLDGESPKEVLRSVNNQLCENNKAEMFVTVWLGILELSTGKLVATNAGHEYPTICCAGGEFELVKDKHGLVLAGMEGVRYREYELQLNAGDTLYLYTDGVPEATNGDNELYGTDRMLQALNRNPEAEPEELLENVASDIDRFMGDAPQFDDITMLGLKLNHLSPKELEEVKEPEETPEE